MTLDQVTMSELTEEGVLALSRAYGEPAWLRDRRQAAYKAFADLEWPHRKVEEWRYTDPRRFDLTRPLRTEGGEPPARERGIIVAAGELDAHVRLVDGAVSEAWVSEHAAAKGVIATDLAGAAEAHPDLVAAHLGSAVGSEGKFDALALAAFTGGAFVYVPPEVELERPLAVSVQLSAAAQGAALLPRVLVVLDHHARAPVYVDQSGDAAATVVGAVEVVVGDSAVAHTVTAQDWGDQVDHISTRRGLVRTGGAYHHLEITLGGKTVYLRPDVRLDGQGAHGELLGVYFTDDRQHFEHRSLIHHNASHTTSEAVYKGTLQGRSQAVWYGNIRIEAHAKATDSDETNRNLILTDGARADSIPWLEILTSDVVGCGHHSSVGQLDELQLFYLESRGIPREHAVRMLLFGFFAEVTDRIELPGVTETVLAELEAEVRRADLALMDPRRSARGEDREPAALGGGAA